MQEKNSKDVIKKEVMLNGRPAGFQHLNLIKTNDEIPDQVRDDNKRQSAFTLIELLVVVLIIGILAAVALPQYTLAVNKTRFSNLRSMAAPFIQAANAYYLANNSWPDNFEELALDMPVGFEITTIPNGNSHFSCGQNNETFCCIAPQDGTAQPIINCVQKDRSFAYSFFLFSRENYCIANKDNANANKLCRALSKRNGNTVWGWYTPNGYIQETKYYLMNN